VRVVLLVDIAVGHVFSVNFELWHRDKRRPTRKASIRLNDPQSSVTNEPDPSLWHWGGAVPMHIDFEDLILRHKQGPEERDFVLSSDLLVLIATKVYTNREVRPSSKKPLCVPIPIPS